MKKLLMTYCVGHLSEKYAPGTIVLRSSRAEDIVYPRGTPVIGRISSVCYFWEEFLGMNVLVARRPRIYTTEAQVLQNGGTLVWIKNPETGVSTPPSYQKCADIRFTIPKGHGAACQCTLTKKAFLMNAWFLHAVDYYIRTENPWAPVVFSHKVFTYKSGRSVQYIGLDACAGSEFDDWSRWYTATAEACLTEARKE